MKGAITRAASVQRLEVERNAGFVASEPGIVSQPHF
jgi:hypothetical protein